MSGDDDEARYYVWSTEAWNIAKLDDASRVGARTSDLVRQFALLLFSPEAWEFWCDPEAQAIIERYGSAQRVLCVLGDEMPSVQELAGFFSGAPANADPWTPADGVYAGDPPAVSLDRLFDDTRCETCDRSRSTPADGGWHIIVSDAGRTDAWRCRACSTAVGDRVSRGSITAAELRWRLGR